MFAFCFLLFAFMCFGQARTVATKLLLLLIAASFTVTLTKDSHYSNLYSIFIVTNTITGAIITSSFPLLMNEHQETTNEQRKEKKTNEHQEKSTHKCCNLQYS